MIGQYCNIPTKLGVFPAVILEALDDSPYRYVRGQFINDQTEFDIIQPVGVVEIFWSPKLQRKYGLNYTLSCISEKDIQWKSQPE